jgi:hypothetical protein
MIFLVCFHRKDVAEKGHSSSVLRLFCQTQPFTVRDVKFAAENGLNQGAGSLSRCVAAVCFLRVHHHIHKPDPKGQQYDYGDSGEKVFTHTMTVIIIAFGSCFYIGGIPDGARVAPCPIDGTVWRKCRNGYHEFIPDLPALFRVNIIKLNKIFKGSNAG